jgi:hypothetical protein
MHKVQRALYRFDGQVPCLYCIRKNIVYSRGRQHLILRRTSVGSMGGAVGLLMGISAAGRGVEAKP